VKDKRSGGPLGAAAERYATETLAGLRKGIEDKKEQLFGDLFKSAGIEGFKGLLKNLNEALDRPENPIVGKRSTPAAAAVVMPRTPFNRIFTALLRGR